LHSREENLLKGVEEIEGGFLSLVRHDILGILHRDLANPVIEIVIHILFVAIEVEICIEEDKMILGKLVEKENGYNMRSGHRSFEIPFPMPVNKEDIEKRFFSFAFLSRIFIYLEIEDGVTGIFEEEGTP
jgi:hypothetical protein